MLNENNIKLKKSKEELEKERRKLLFEKNQLDNEILKERKKRITIIFLITLVVVLIIKIFFGTIELYNILGYPPSKSRIYKTSINDTIIAVESQIHKKTPIIPYLLNFNSYYGTVDFINGDENIYFYVDDSKKFLLNIESYSCYHDKSQVECKVGINNQTRIKNNDTKYTNLFIRKNGNTETVKYDGEFKSDITEYITEKGNYYVEITAKYSLIETKISFNIKNDK